MFEATKKINKIKRQIETCKTTVKMYVRNYNEFINFNFEDYKKSRNESLQKMGSTLTFKDEDLLKKFNETKEQMEFSLKFSKRDFNKANKKMEQLNKELKEAEKEEQVEKNAVERIPAIESFLEEWKTKARIYYTKQMENEKNTEAVVQALRNGSLNLEKFLSDEVDVKRADLIARVEKIAGKIKDASALRIGMNGSLNGYVAGEKKTVEVRTIDAGGVWIQCYHYRVLVK